jgi:CheY-like chemotaxis protein
MGGSIGFESRPGRGSVFRFTLPLKTAAPGEAGADEEGSPVRVPAVLRNSAVLVVEDHDLNRKVATGMLAMRGIRSVEAKGGEEALAALRASPYPVIFTDLHMPGMDGLELARRIRALPGGEAPLIVGVTADAMEETLERCLRGGMDDVLTKPILSRDLDALLERMETRLEERPAKRGPEVRAPDADSPASMAAYPIAAKPGAEARAATAPGWVDHAQVRELDEWVRVHDRGFWPRTAAQFRHDMARLLKALREELAVPRLEDACETAHSIKGVCLMLGFGRLGRMAKEMEDLIREGRMDAWPGKLDGIEAGVEPSLADLMACLDRLAVEQGDARATSGSGTDAFPT